MQALWIEPPLASNCHPKNADQVDLKPDRASHLPADEKIDRPYMTNEKSANAPKKRPGQPDRMRKSTKLNTSAVHKKTTTNSK